MAQTTEENWTTVIKPRNGLFEVNLKEIWDYRDLLTLFVKRTITVQYKQTILGPLWWIIQPALTVIMYMVVFGGIAGIPTDGIPQPLFYWVVSVCGSILRTVWVRLQILLFPMQVFLARSIFLG